VRKVKWLVILGLFIATHSFGDELSMKGVSWDGAYVASISQMQELGANTVRPDITWKEVEPVILDPTLTVALVDANPGLISGYAGIWTSVDSMVDSLFGAGFAVVPRIGIGFLGKIPDIGGEQATPDRLGQEHYLGCIYRHARALVRRYKDRVHHWQIEGELNEAPLTHLYGWRGGEAWQDESFLLALNSTLHDAVRAEDASAKIIIAFHTDIHENIHDDPVLGLWEFAGEHHWTEWLTIWEPYLDIVGLGCYPNYYIADPVYGTEVGDRVATAKSILPGKPVIITETSYPAPAPGTILPDPVDFTEEKQRQYIRDAVYSCIDNGAMGYFHFTIKSAGVIDIYTAKDLEALSVLGPAFHDGDVAALYGYALVPGNYEYVQNALPGILLNVEPGWGLIRGDDSKRPAFFELQTAFANGLPIDQVNINLSVGWNLFSLRLMPLNLNPAAVLSSIAGRYDEVWAYDAATKQWFRYEPGGSPDSNTLSEIRAGLGYWIKMNQVGILSVYGTQPATGIPLKTGWNLVGWNLQNSKGVESAMLSMFGAYNSVWTFDPVLGWLYYTPDGPIFTSNMTTMGPDYGYWIDSEEDRVWEP